MKYKTFSITIILVLFLSTMGSLSAVNLLEPNIIYVSVNGNDSNAGLAPELSKKTIKNAAETAKSGDIIQIAPGTYKEDMIDITDKKLTLRGEDPKTTIIQGKSKNRANIIAVDGSDVLIQKLTITKTSSKKVSRGIWNHGILTVEDSIITGHTTERGGSGITTDGSLTLKNCQITNNHAEYYGAGIHNYGGSVHLQNSVVSNNENYQFLGGSHGGGISTWGGVFIIENSTITSNYAKQGGGIYICYDGILNIVNSEISNNVALRSGGGIYKYDNSKINLKGVTFSGNKPDITAG